MQPTFDWRQRKNLAEDEEAEDTQGILTGAEIEGDGDAGSLMLGSWRTVVTACFFLVILLAVVARLVPLTVLPASAAANKQGAPARPPMLRGRILDRNGLLMATDTFYGQVWAWPEKFKDPKTGTFSKVGASTVVSASLALQQPAAAIQASVAVTTPMVLLGQRVTVDQCEGIKAIGQGELVSCDFEREPAYPQASLAAHVLGFQNRDRLGLYGIEARYDNWLNPARRWQGNVPAGTMPMLDSWKLYLPSPAGHDLVLNLDVPLQYVVEKRLQEAMAAYKAEAGTIILMDPRTGAVLAMANYPTFDPNQFSAVHENTWVNSAISEIYEPGSVFKLVTMAAGLDAGYITPDSPFYDEGSLEVGGRVVRNAERIGYGNVTVRQALALSLNVVSAKIALQTGPETFYKYVGLFGFGKQTEVDLQGEVNGIVKQPGRGSEWSQYDLAANSFGQGISVTSFQMINAVAAIANRGVMLQPQVVRAMVQNGGAHPIEPRVLGRPIRPETALALTQMMAYTVDKSAFPNLVPGYRIAGKTGTAEIPTKEGYTSLESIMSFIGFLPAADPQLVIMVKLVKPKGVLWAEQVSMPVFGQVAQEAVRILDIKPDNRNP